ncbi:PIR Superfamily Protein [Plasmodium ovale curtisi]|uniref:PIR Superfamily Protein n=1 Tax=Plasmodium ovale curtisi TaxID=864141 RepID=A0A1A8WCR7_PLAOA|nr:PIR Superfamily Protein [Plasmodium ovale curtisi]
MSGQSVSECILGTGDLPAKDFDDKWKNETNFLKFSNAALLSHKMNNMENWITSFKGKLFTIYTDNTLGDLSHIQDKRCRDLNYYINYMLYYIPKITHDTENTADIMDRFQSFVTALFISWKHHISPKKFKCARIDKVYTPKMELIKELDDYCENKNAFKKKLEKYDKTICCKYANHVNERKSAFYRYISKGNVQINDADFHFYDNCTLKDIGKTFPDIICNENSMSETESAQIPTPYANPRLPEANPQGSIDTSATKIAVTSVTTLFGACISGLYLYRNSFLGNILRKFKNNNIIADENAYDDVNEMISEIPSQYIDSTEDSNKFYIAYNPMNN